MEESRGSHARDGVDLCGTYCSTEECQIREADIVPSPDLTRVAFVRHSAGRSDSTVHTSDLVVRSLTNGSESTLAQDSVSIMRLVWSPDGASLAYTTGSKTINHDEAPAYSGDKIIYRIWEYVPGQINAVKVAGGQPVT